MSAVDVRQRQDVVTSVQSRNAIRNAVRTAISSIAYLRNLFEESAFESKVVSGMELKLLKPVTLEAELVLSWLEQGVFEALEKGYLKALVFGMHDRDDNLLECFYFQFSYADGEAEMNVTRDQNGRTVVGPAVGYTKEDVKDATMDLLQNVILLTQQLSPLPADRYISMKLNYYDEKTPSSYEPAFFRPATDAERLLFKDVPLECDFGTIQTGHHSMSIKLKTLAEGPADEHYDSQEKYELLAADSYTQEAPKELDVVLDPLEALLQRPEVTKSDLQSALGLTVKQAESRIQALVKEGTLLPFNRSRRAYPVARHSFSRGKRLQAESVNASSKRIRVHGRKRRARVDPQPPTQPSKGPRRKAVGPKSPTRKIAPSHSRLIQALKGFPTCGVKRISIKDNKALFSLRDGDLRVVNLAHSRTPCLKIVDKQRGYDVADFGADSESIWAVRGHEMDLVLIQCTENGCSVVLEGSAVPQPVIKSYFAGDLPFVIVCGANKDTSFSVMAHSGNLVKTYSSKQIEINDFAVGGSLVGAASWSAGVQLYFVSTKTLDSDPLKRAVMLPTLAGADAIAIDRTGSKTAIVDKAGRLQTYNTDCYFGEQERARLLQETTVPATTKLLRFSYDSRHLVMACGADIAIRDASTLQIVDEIRDAHTSAIRCLETSQDSNIFVTTCLQGNPRVWRI